MSDLDNARRTDASDAARQVIAGLFYASPQAEVALTELKAAGYRDAELSEVASVENESAATELRRAVGETTGATFFREHETRASAFAHELVALDFSNADAEHLVDSIVRGKTVVTVDTAPLGAGAAEIIFERHTATIYRSRSVAEAFPIAPPVEELPPDVPYETVAEATPDVTQERMLDEERRVLELREEQLVVEKETAAYAEATVSKRVVTEMQTIEVPVMREELVIERVPVASESGAGPIEAGEPGEQIVIPLSREVVHVDKVVVPIAEVTVGIRQVESVEHVEETLRREELVVEHEHAPEP